MKTKLSPACVAELRRMWATGRYKQYELAQLFGIHKGQVSRLVRLKSQSQLPTTPGVFERILANVSR